MIHSQVMCFCFFSSTFRYPISMPSPTTYLPPFPIKIIMRVKSWKVLLAKDTHLLVIHLGIVSILGCNNMKR